MEMRTKGFRVAAATAACIASLGFAACGGDDDESSDEGAATATEETGATGAEGTADAGAVEEMFRSEFEAQGLDDAQVDCAIEAMDEEIDAEEYLAAVEENEATGGETPPEFVDAVQAAIADCQ